MRTINIPGSMLELLFNLPDEQLAEIVMERPDVMQSICLGVSLELYEREQLESISYRRKLH
jgi:hypothetical protein